MTGKTEISELKFDDDMILIKIMKYNLNMIKEEPENEYKNR